jgi:hypothetical protein
MRRRAAALLIATLTASALVVGIAGESGAAVKRAKAPLCKGKTKKKAAKAIEDAYFHFLDGATSPTADVKEPFIQFMSGDHTSPQFIADFEASAAKNAGDASNTSVQVNKVTCTGKKTADVLYDLVLGGTPAPGLAPPGDAILEGKQWKVTGQAVCNLQALGDPSVLEAGPCSEILLDGEPSDLT